MDVIEVKFLPQPDELDIKPDLDATNCRAIENPECIIKQDAALEIVKCEVLEADPSLEAYAKSELTDYGNLTDKATATMEVTATVYECKLCSYRSPAWRDVQQHMMTGHRTKKRYSCKECCYCTDMKRDFVIHSGTHRRDKPFKCDLCDYRAANTYYVRRHKQMTHLNEHVFKCGECSYTCKSKNAFKCHKNIHSGKRFKCDMCCFVSHDRQNTLQHRKCHAKEGLSKNPLQMPTTRRYYRCDKCKFAYTDINLLVTHMKTHL